ncbi:MAG: DUF3108 domain-containing protein [Candidatus Omnitrophica bacterium]|nr:DUF3108 domain-containing protein [Candidatus Omnitrophota bacterium]HOX55133.1 DUF3108 domain-containing protein [Candidatus Omnitrophota bacterium]
MRIMKIVFVTLLIILALLILREIIKDSPSLLIKNFNNKNLDSKSLSMKIKFLGILPAATAKIEDLGTDRLDRKSVLHFRATAKTMDYFSKIFNAQMQADSFVDSKTLCPLKFIQQVKTPGTYNYNRELVYDHKQKIMNTGDVQRVIFEDTRDPISAIFYLRSQEFQVGKEIQTHINTNQKNYIMIAKVSDYKELVLGNGKVGYWIVTAEVKRADKSPRHKSRLTIWFFNNKDKTPFLIKIVTAGGLVTVSLTGLD